MRRLKLNNFTEQRYPREIRCSPDGRRYAFSLRSISDDRASYCHDLYVGKIDGPPPVKLTDDGRQAMVFWDDNDHLITCSPMDTRPDSPWVFSRINVSTGQSEPFVCLSVMPIRMWHLPGGKYLLWGQSMGTHLFGQTRADGVDDEKRRLFIFDKASGQAHPLTDVDQNVVHEIGRGHV